MYIEAERFIKLKARVKAEMLRRKYNGSVSSYGDTQYDYNDTPAKGSIIKSEHRDKLIIPMRAINSDTIPEANGSIVTNEELVNIENTLTKWESTPITSNSNNCKSSCTGLCYTACSTGCSGCSGCSGCGSGCSGGCSGCGSACSSGCSGCIGTCEGTCSVNCTSGCAGTCYKSCTETCSAVCALSCSRTNS